MTSQLRFLSVLDTVLGPFWARFGPVLHPFGTKLLSCLSDTIRHHPDEIRSAGRNQNSDDSGDSSSGLDQDLDGYADDDTSDEDTSDEEEILDVIGTSSSSEGSPAEEEESPAEDPTSRYGRRRADFRQQGCISWDNIQFVDRR